MQKLLYLRIHNFIIKNVIDNNRCNEIFNLIKFEFFLNNNRKFFTDIIIRNISKNYENFVIVLIAINKIRVNDEIILFILEKSIVVK